MDKDNLEKLKELKAMAKTRIHTLSEWIEMLDNIIIEEDNKKQESFNINTIDNNDYNDPDPYAKDYMGKGGFIGNYDDPYDPYSKCYAEKW